METPCRRARWHRPPTLRPSATTFHAYLTGNSRSWWATGPRIAMEGRPPADFKEGLKTELYDLKADPSEQTNLATQYPAILAEMEKHMAEARSPSTLYPFKHLDPQKPTHPFISAHHACMASARASFLGISLSSPLHGDESGQALGEELTHRPVPNATARNCKEVAQPH